MVNLEKPFPEDTKEGTATLENQTLHAKGGVLYKVNYSSQQSLTSNTIENIGNNL